MFDFDTFVNRPCIGGKDKNGNLKEGIFGRQALYMPADENNPPFKVLVDFHKAYEKVELQVGHVPITSTEITAFLRDAHLPEEYPEILQGDNLLVGDVLYQIIDVKEHIPGTKALVLHETS